jgi:predicted anti-sigma-YlaC factor YlaD
MSAHITHEEMTELLVGARTNTLDSHLQVCAECREELARVKGSLESFRTASLAWSERITSEAAETQQVIALSRRHSYVAWWRLAAIAAVLLIVFAAAYRIKRSAVNDNTAMATPGAAVVESTQGQIAEEQIAQDNELLAQVNSEISESVPSPMQPLQISAASSGSSSQKTK